MWPIAEKSEKIEMLLSCRQVKDIETFSKTDPYVEVYLGGANNYWKKIGETEVIDNNLDPDFVYPFYID